MNASAQALLESAIRAATGRKSVTAHLRQTSDFFGKTVVGSGDYREMRQGRVQLLRMEITAAVDDQAASRTIVCDGNNLWTYQHIIDDQQLSRIDVRRALQAIDHNQAAATPMEKAVTLPGLGGLERMLRGLDRSFEFDTAELVEWGGAPCWRLLGQWRPQQLAKLLPEQKEAIERHKPIDLDKLPPQLPDQVVLFLGRDDLFPYRISYCRHACKKQLLTSYSAQKTLLAIEFFDVNFSARQDPSHFTFQPGNLRVVDRTEEFIRSLK